MRIKISLIYIYICVCVCVCVCVISQPYHDAIKNNYKIHVCLLNRMTSFLWRIFVKPYIYIYIYANTLILY